MKVEPGALGKAIKTVYHAAKAASDPRHQFVWLETGQNAQLGQGLASALADERLLVGMFDEGLLVGEVRPIPEALLALPERILIFGSLCTVQDQTRYDRDYREWLEPEPEQDPIVIPSGQMELLPFSELPEPVRVPDAPGRWIDGMAPPQVEEAGGEGVCLVGAFAWYKQVQAGKTPEEAFAALPTLYYDDGDGPFETAWEGQKAGLTYQLAWRLGTLNDEHWQEFTPAERWQKAMDWLDEQLAKPYDPKLAR